MRQSEFKRRYDPDLGKYVMRHIYSEDTYGEGMSDIFKSLGSKISEVFTKKAAKSAVQKAATATGRKAGDKIVKLLSQNKTTTPSILMEQSISILPNTSPSESKVLTTEEINNRVNQILSGGKLRRSKFI